MKKSVAFSDEEVHIQTYIYIYSALKKWKVRFASGSIYRNVRVTEIRSKVYQLALFFSSEKSGPDKRLEDPGRC